MGWKLPPSTSVLFQRLAPSQKLDASDWQVPGVHPKRADATPSVRAYALKTRGLPPELIIYQSLSQQPRASFLGCRSVSAYNASLTGVAERLPRSLSPAPPPTCGPSQRFLCGKALPVLINAWQNLHYTSLRLCQLFVIVRTTAHAKSAFSLMAERGTEASSNQAKSTSAFRVHVDACRSPDSRLRRHGAHSCRGTGVRGDCGVWGARQLPFPTFALMGLLESGHTNTITVNTLLLE